MLLTLAMFLGLPSVAQTITGTIRGTVTDPSGAVLAGASVTATDTATGVKTNTVTNPQGAYNIQFLPIGPYMITVASPGFETASIGPFVLEIDQTAKIDTRLKVGNASVTVNVDSDVSPIMQTQDATLGSTLSANTLSSLPLNGLDFQYATLFVPGAVSASSSSMSGTDGSERQTDAAASPSFNGNRAQVNNYVLDGIEMNETMNNMASYNPAPDAIEEMRVLTGNENAEYGNVNGGEVLVVTKGGTNQYHGSAYDYFQNNFTSANTWSDNHARPIIPLSAYTQDQFGATISGPIKKDKLFLFGDYLGFRNHSGGVALATVPTVAMRDCKPKGGVTTCDFSELLTPTFGNIQLFNNQNGKGFSNATPYKNNQIPLVNPVAKFLYAHPEAFPLPNRAPQPAQGNVVYGDLHNYQGSNKYLTYNNQGDVRVDYKASSRDAVMGRYTIGDAYDTNPVSALPVFFPVSDDYPFQSLAFNEVHTFSSILINEFRAGVTRTVWMHGVPSDPSGIFGTDGNSKVGLPFANQKFPGFSSMSIGSWESNVGTVAGVNEFHENNFFYGDNLTWQHANHTIKFGVQVVRYQQNSYYAGQSGAMGSFSFPGTYTENTQSSICGNNNTQQPCGGYGFADFLMDESSSAAVGGVAGATGQRQYRNAYYAQDDWRVRHNLTVNIGLRYAHDQPLYEVNNKEANVDLSKPAAGLSGVMYAGKNGNSRALYNPFYLEFMPRIGFALQASPRFVVRGGYGITDDFEGMGSATRLTQNPPFMHQFSNTSAPPTVLSSGQTPMKIENGFNLPASTSYSNFYAWKPDLKPSLIQQFNLAWQYLIDSKTSAQVGYVGELGQHLTVPGEAAQWSTPATGNIGNNDCSGTIAPAAPFCQLVGNNGNLNLTMSSAYSNYHAMQATYRHQATSGLEYTLNYTWSKAMTNNAGFYGVTGVAESSSFFQDYHNPHGDYGPAGDDTRQALNGYGMYQLPLGRGKKFGGGMNRIMDELLGGWKLSGDVILYSGFPVTMYSPNNYYVNNWGSHSMHFRQMHIRHRSVLNWFGDDPSVTPCLGLDAKGNTIDNGTCAYGVESENGFGNTRNGSERAPGYRQIDLAAFKTFTFGGTHTLQLRGEAFNAFNFASYAPPDSSLPDYSSQVLGEITGTNSSPRAMQVSMHYNF
jgi:hypothetical protein